MIIIAAGANSASAVFVAINDTPQKTTAAKGFQYLINLVFILEPELELELDLSPYFDFVVFLAEEYFSIS
jgi:hypothetical protein